MKSFKKVFRGDFRALELKRFEISKTKKVLTAYKASPCTIIHASLR